MESMAQAATRHMMAGVQELYTLAELIERDVGKAPTLTTIRNYRSKFRKRGKHWMDEEAAKSMRWRSNNQEKVRAKNRQKVKKWRDANRAKCLWYACAGTSRRRGYEFTITAADVEALVQPMVCQATGLPLSWDYDGDARANPWSPSVDRIDCSKGYTPDNVRVVCWAYNQMRGDFPDEVVTMLALALSKKHMASA